MDPLTAAIVAAVAAGGSKVATEVVPDLYRGLKALIKRKFGEQNAVSKAVDEVEADPESAGRKIVLEEKVKKAGADKDADIVAAAKKLLEQLEAQPGGTHRADRYGQLQRAGSRSQHGERQRQRAEGRQAEVASC